LGPEAGEATGGTRANFDDVDDYNGWSASPPVNKEGTPHANASEFMTSVTVDYVDPDDLTHAVGSEMGVKRIGVTVTKDGRTLASFTTVVTKRS
jgi:hypothetical protein